VVKEYGIGQFSDIPDLVFYQVFTNKLLEKNVNNQYSGKTNTEITESITALIIKKIVNDYHLKSCIFIMVEYLWITVNYHEFICGQKVVRCVSMA